MYILEEFAKFVPEGRTVRLTLLPEKPIDVWVLSETRIDFDETCLNGKENVYYSSFINLYCRQSPGGTSTYSSLVKDVMAFYNTLGAHINQKVGDFSIMNVRDFELLPLGRDEKGNYLISCNFVVDYE